MRHTSVAQCLLVGMVALLSPLSSQERLGLSVDHAVFGGYENTDPYIEIYYAVPRANLSFDATDNTAGVSGQLVIAMRMTQDGKVVLDDSWRLDVDLSDSNEIRAGTNILDQRRYAAAPGEYELWVWGVDGRRPQRRDSVRTVFTVPGIGNGLRMSDIEFCSAIKTPTDRDPRQFVKNEFVVLPHPQNTFGVSFPVLYYYVELYNAGTSLQGDEYFVRAQVSPEGRGVRTAVAERLTSKKKTADVIAEMGHLNIHTLRTGAYSLLITIESKDSVVQTSQARRFFIYNPVKSPAQAETQPDISNPVFMVMSEEECDVSFDQARPIATTSEITLFESLSGADSKREFLQRFWRNRDAVGSGSVESSYGAYQRRVEYVARQFRWFTKKGWKTDRGRIYLRYGPADDVERFPNVEGMRPHEVWHYNNLQGGVYFVFGDRRGNGEYMLLHSTALGHLQDPNWSQWLSK